MTDFDVQAVDLSGVLNTTVEQKASQIPEPVTYHILCMLPKAEETIEGSTLVKTSTMMHHEELLSPVLFVAKIGPDAFPKDKFPSGPSCKVGDFILTRPNTGTRMKIHSTEWRLINDDSVEAVVQDPRGIQRP
jgi:co-chaperonin GroES (HSP10)